MEWEQHRISVLSWPGVEPTVFRLALPLFPPCSSLRCAYQRAVAIWLGCRCHFYAVAISHVLEPPPVTAPYQRHLTILFSNCVFIHDTASFSYHGLRHNCFLPDLLSGSFCQNIFLFFISLVSFITLFCPTESPILFIPLPRQGQKPEEGIVPYIESWRLAL